MRPEKAKRVLVTLPDGEPGNLDTEELRIFAEECGELLYDLGPDDEQNRVPIRDLIISD
jgi:hypothetical protein